MGFAIANENGAICIHKDAMRTGHGALQGIAVTPVAFLTSACDEVDRACGRLHHADRVAFAIRQPGIARGIEGDAFGTAEGGFSRRSAMAGQPFLPVPAM